MDNTAGFYPVNMGSIPVGGANNGVCDVMVASEIVILFAWVRFPSFSPSLQL